MSGAIGTTTWRFRLERVDKSYVSVETKRKPDLILRLPFVKSNNKGWKFGCSRTLGSGGLQGILQLLLFCLVTVVLFVLFGNVVVCFKETYGGIHHLFARRLRLVELAQSQKGPAPNHIFFTSASLLTDIHIHYIDTVDPWQTFWEYLKTAKLHLKISTCQNTTNRMCIKHCNLQCFLSMSLNAFNTTLGKWYIPSLSGGPWGGGYHIYIIYIIYTVYTHSIYIYNIYIYSCFCWR